MDMPGKIPGGITVEDFSKITGFLRQILTELQSEGTGAKRVVSRLNNSLRNNPDPIFAGIVEDTELTKQREAQNKPDTGLFRFGDDNKSKVYDDALNDPSGNVIRRNWDQDRGEKSSHARRLGIDVGCNHQRFIAIRVPVGNQHQHVGTITVGFDRDPTGHESAIEKIMKKWARSDQNSAYVKFLTDNFNLSGPKF
jgi:hypothetical protein